MPLPIDITALLSGSLVESERVELKEGWNPESVLHTLCSVIVNYPGTDRSVRLDQLRQSKAVPRRYRNRRIGDFLKELDITEGRSTGIPKILRAMKKNGSPPPVFDFDEDHSYFLIRLPVHKKDKVAAAPQVTGQVEPWMMKVLKSCELPLKSSEIQEIVGIQHRETFQRNYLDRLLETGLIERTIPDKSNSRLQKYCLTDKGRASSWVPLAVSDRILPHGQGACPYF